MEVTENHNKNRKQQTQQTTKFVLGEKIITDNSEIADQFNKYFVNVGASLDEKIPRTNISPTSYISKSITNSIFFEPIIHEEVISIINSLRNSSPGWDNIPADIIKKTCNTFIAPLTYILNLAMLEGIFPDELKIAKVIPLFKAGDTSVFANYRPVSVLPSFSKILEKLIYKRIVSFVTKHEILYDSQFGFRKNKSTALALLKLVDKVSEAIDKGNYVLRCIFRLFKSF